MKLTDIGESVAGPEKCWPGHRKVGTKPGTGKNAGKRVNDCEKIKEDVDTVDQGEYDQEGGMAIGQLSTIEDAAAELSSILAADDNLPEWVQSKITKAVDYIDTARDYMKSKEGVAEGYPKHQDLSGISTDKLKAYLAKQNQQQVPGEGNQVKRVRAELQRREERNFGNIDDEEENKWWIDYDLDEGVAEGGYPEVDHMPGPTIKRTQTGCKRCHGKGYVYKTDDGEVHPMNRPDAKKYKCGKCNGIGFVKVTEQDVAEGSEQVYNILALDKGNALKKPTKLKWKASSLEDIFDALAAQDWYPLEINGVEVIAGKRLKQGVAEAGNKPLEKSRFGMGDTRTPRDIKSQMHSASDEFVKSTADKKTGPFHSKVAHMQGKMAKSELRKREQGVAEGMLDNPGEQDSPVAQAIIRRILLQRTDLLAKHGPEKVGQAVDEVADFVGDVDEIGSSDVSGWVRHVEQMLGNMQEGVAEGTDTLNVGDDVIITGAVKYKGATGVVDSVGRDGNFIVVNLYNHGKQSFQSTDVSFNDYAGSEAEESEIQQRGLGESAPRSALGESVAKDIKKYGKINEKMSDMEKTAVRSVVKAKHGKEKPTTSDVKKTIKFVKNKEGIAEAGGEKQYNAFKREWRAKHGSDAKVPGYDSKEYTSYCYRQNDKKQGVEEGAKVDRMVKHIKKSEEKAGKSADEAEDIAWATANKRGMLDNKNKKTESTKARASKKY